MTLTEMTRKPRKSPKPLISFDKNGIFEFLYFSQITDFMCKDGITPGSLVAVLHHSLSLQCMQTYASHRHDLTLQEAETFWFLFGCKVWQEVHPLQNTVLIAE
jgi:hypothetical protein